ncbi:efflux RND transporter permease subunit [Kaarinaea lacus]
MQNFDSRLAHWIIRKRWWLIVITALLASVTASGMLFITIDSDLRVFFAKDDPRLVELEALENTYTKHESIILIVAPKNGQVFTSHTLSAVKELTEASWQMPFSSRVDSITNFQFTSADQDELIVEDFIPHPDLLDAAQLEEKRQQALTEPLLVKRLLAGDATTTAVMTNVIFAEKAPEAVEQIAEFSRQLRDEFQAKYPDIDFYLTGSVMFDMAFSEVGRHDMLLLAPLMFLILVLVVGFSVRSVVATVATMFVVLLSMLSAMGIAGWLGISINPASANAPTIILTLAVADSVHILVAMYRLMYAGKHKNDALVESLTVNLQAVFLTSLTTAIGFLTMNFSESPPFHDLGNIVAVGITMAFLYSVFFLPALIAVLPVKARYAPVIASHDFFQHLSGWVFGRQTLIIVSLGVVVTIGGVIASRNVLNDNWIQYFSDNIPVRVATDVMEQRLSGSDYVEYSLPAKEPGAIADPEYLNQLEQFAQWLRQQPEVVHVYTVSDIFKRLNKNMHNDDETWYRLPKSRELAAQYLLLYEMSLPLGLDLNNQINVDKSATRIIVTVKNLGTRAFRGLDQRAQQWLQENLPSYMHIRGSGLSIVWAYLSKRNIVNMLFAAFAALFAIALVMLIALKRVDMGLISLIPNLTPALLAFGLWAVFVGEVGLGLSVVSSMTLGIVVDDTVHFITKYLRFCNHDRLTPELAIQETFYLVGPAMAVTTLALVAGFLVLTFSDYKMSADMGLLSAITVSIALLMDFLLLPALLLKLSRFSHDRSGTRGKLKPVA